MTRRQGVVSTIVVAAVAGGTSSVLANPPLPTAGQTVRWTRAMSPLQISGQPAIPDSGTVIIEAGAQVNIAASSYLMVQGRLLVEGTPSQRIQITGTTTSSILTSNGSVEFSFTDVGVQVGAAGFDPALDLDSGIFRNCTFTGGPPRNASWHVNVIEDCSYAGTWPVTIRHAGRVKNFTSTRTIHLREGLFSLDNVTVQGAAPHTMNGPEQTSGLYVTGTLIPTAIDHVNILNSTGAGIFTRFGNIVIGDDTVIQGNRIAVQLDRTGGLMTGSHVPSTGNTINGYVPVSDSNGTAFLSFLPSRPAPITNKPAIGPDPIWGALGFTDCVWGNVDIPYVVTGVNGSVNGGSLTVPPGVSLMMAPGAILHTFDTGRMNLLGTPASPLLLTRLDPAQPWSNIAFTSYGKVSNATVEGATIGLSTGGGTTMPELLDCLFRNNDEGLLRGSRPRKSRFYNNRIGASDRSTSTYQTRLQLNNPDAPNAFVGNTQYGVYEDPNDLITPPIQAQNIWWGSPTGPRNAAGNPTGMGDEVYGAVQAVPFRTTEPDWSDTLPIVRIRPTGLLEPLAKTTLRWDAEDDRGITEFRVKYATASNVNNAAYTTLATLPGSAREYELTVPDVGFFNSRDTFIRVEAVDTSGQISVDELVTTIPNSRNRPLEVTITSNFPGRTVRPGELIDPQVQRTVSDGVFSNSYELYLQLDNDGVLHHIGNGDINSGLYLDAAVPAVSTDSARLVVKFQGSLNIQKWFFTAPFAIRPDDRFADAAPSIALTNTPTTAQAGSSVDLNWTSSDDRALRMFRVLQSTDNARTWHPVEDNLAPDTRSYRVKLAPGEGFPSLHLRVVAVDSIFQNTSATTQPILVSGGAACATADFNGDGDFGTDADIEAFFACLAGSCCPTCWHRGPDFNADGDAGTDADIEAFFRVLAGGNC